MSTFQASGEVGMPQGRNRPYRPQMLPVNATTQQVNEEFARRMAHYITERGFNQRDLAREASKHMPKGKTIRPDNVSLWARALQRPGPLRLRALALALGVQDVELLPTPASEHQVSANAPPFLWKRSRRPGYVWITVKQEIPQELGFKIAALLGSAREP